MEKNPDQYNEPLCNEDPGKTNDILQPNNSKMYEKESRYNELLCNEDPGITNDILQSNNSKCMEKNPDITNPYVTKTPV